MQPTPVQHPGSPLQALRHSEHASAGAPPQPWFEGTEPFAPLQALVTAQLHPDRSLDMSLTAMSQPSSQAYFA